jgi:hypothetical protein
LSSAIYRIGFEVLTAVSMKIAVFWVVAGLHGATTQKTAIFIYRMSDKSYPISKLIAPTLKDISKLLFNWIDDYL